MSSALLALSIATAIGSAISGGVFFAFSSFVMRALARLEPAEGIRAMNSINVTVINPLFMSILFGSGPLAIATAIIGASEGEGAACLAAAAAVYVVGTIGVTMRFNVPRNNVLAALDPESADAPAVWERYVAEWTTWNTVRTIACLAAAALAIAAIAAA